MHYVHIYNVGLFFKVLDKSSRLPTLHFQSLSLGKRLQEIMSLNSRAIKMLSMVIFIVGNKSNLNTFNIYRVEVLLDQSIHLRLSVFGVVKNTFFWNMPRAIENYDCTLSVSTFRKHY